MPGSNSSQVSGGGMVLPEGVEVRGSRGTGGVWAKTPLARGTRYGPLPPYSSSHHPYNQEERLHIGNGYLEEDDWMRCVRSSASDLFNLRPVLDSGMMFFETTEEVKPGEELILGPKEFFRPADSSIDDKDTGGSQNSGEDKEDEEDYPRCPACDTPFQDSDLLDEHLVKKHRYESGQHRCEACGRGYAWRPCLTRHRSLAHGAPSRRYPCENCPKTFSDPSNLQRHIRSRHAGARSHACTECGKTFATSSGLKQHTHIHSSVKPFQCEVCYKAYTQFSNLCRHKRMHVSCRMQSKCNKCGQTFSTGTSLAKHKRFCDSSSGVNMNSLPPGGSSPFLLYPPRPGLPFYPPGLVPPYSGLFHSPTAPPPGFLPNSLLFAPHHKSSEDESMSSSAKMSSMQRMRTESNSTCSPIGSPGESPSPMHDSSSTPNNSFVLMNKVSPPTAEEAASSERPSPARPPMSATYPNPKVNIPSFTESNEEHTPVSSKRPYKCESSDQPLDLSVSKKDEHRCDSPPKGIKRSRLSSPVRSDYSEKSDEDIEPDSPVKVSTPEPVRDASPLPLTPKKEVEVESTAEESPNNQPESLSLKPLSDLKETIEKTDNENNNRMPMAYPRPIHPLFLEALYRPPFPNFGRDATGVADQVFNQNPFGVRPAFPFLGHLMNGMARQNRSFEMMRPPMPSYPTKTFSEGMTPNGQKMKDRYACKFCGKVFPRSANLTRHLRTHTGEQPYKCPYCERSFSISSNLQRHIRNIHNKEKPFKCSMCDRCFGQQTNLDRHIKKHSSEDGIISVEDSPDNSNENEREDAYFDEIRSFMGKVTYGGGPEQIYTPTSLYHPALSSSKDDDESSDTSLSPSYHKQELPLAMVIPKHLSASCKDEPLLNNNDQQEPLHIST